MHVFIVETYCTTGSSTEQGWTMQTSIHSSQNVSVLLRTATRYEILNSAQTDLSKAADNTCAEVSLDP